MFKDSSRMCTQINLAQYSYHKHLGCNVYKTFKWDKNQVPYCNVIGSKKWKLCAINRKWPTLDNLIIWTFISENNRYYKHLYKIWREFIS